MMTAAADKGRLEHTALAAPQEVGQLLSCSVASRLDRRALLVVVAVVTVVVVVVCISILYAGMIISL